MVPKHLWFKKMVPPIYCLGLFRVTVGFDLVPKHLGSQEKVPSACCSGLFRVTVGFDVCPSIYARANFRV